MTGLPRSAAVEIVVDAAPSAVWAVLADVTRVGEWSGECTTARWLGGARAPAVGARFRGYNRAGLVRWSRVAELVLVEPQRELRWRTHGPAVMGDSTEWRVRLEPAGAGTRIVQEYAVLSLPVFWEKVFSVIIPEHRDRRAGLRADLARLGAVAAASRTAAPRAAAPRAAAPRAAASVAPAPVTLAQASPAPADAPPE